MFSGPYITPYFNVFVAYGALCNLLTFDNNWCRNSVLPWTTYITLHKLHYLPKPEFLHVNNRVRNDNHLLDGCKVSPFRKWGPGSPKQDISKIQPPLKDPHQLKCAAFTLDSEDCLFPIFVLDLNASCRARQPG